MVKLPATHCSRYEPEISQKKFFVAMLRPVKSMKFSTSKILGYTVLCSNFCNVNFAYKYLNERHQFHKS